MNIIIHVSNYAPEWVGIGHYTAELRTWLAKWVHQVLPPIIRPGRLRWITSTRAGGGGGLENIIWMFG